MAIDAVCAVWLETRTPALDALLTERRWVASQPATLRVATALHNGNLGLLANGDPEMARALVEAAEQERCLERQRAHEALVALRRPASREAVCRLAIEGGRPAALEAALAGSFAASDPGRRALLLFLGGEFERYAELDFDGSLLRAAHKVAGKGLRRRLAEKARAAGRVEWVRAVAGGRRRRRLSKLSDEEWETAISVLVAAERWEELWRLALEAPAVWGARMLRELGQRGFRPAEEKERASCAALIELAGACRAETPVLEGHAAGVRCLAVTPDGGTERLWELPSGAPTTGIGSLRCLTARGQLIVGTYEHTYTTYLHGGGDLLVGYLPQVVGSLELRQLASKEAPVKLNLIGGVEYLTVTTDGGLAVAGIHEYRHDTIPGSGGNAFNDTDRRTVQLRRLPSGKLAGTLKGYSDRISCLAVTPDGRLLASGSADGTIRLWRLPSRRPHRTLNGHTGEVSCLAVSPDGRFLASGSSKEATVRIWRLPSGKPAVTLNGHTGGILSLAFSPDGALLASRRLDRAIRLWPWTLRVLARKPLGKVSLTEVERLRQSYGELSAVERAWIELITALVHWRHRHDIELVEVPRAGEAGNSDIELGG